MLWRGSTSAECWGLWLEKMPEFSVIVLIMLILFGAEYIAWPLYGQKHMVVSVDCLYLLKF